LQTYTTAVTTGGGDGALTLSVNSIINQSAAFGWSVETLVPNTWTHVAVTWNSVTDGVLHLYINGVECTYQDATISKVADSGDSGAWVFGSDNGGYNLPNGSLAECVIYNTALSGGQIAALAASTIGATGSPTNYWHLCGTTSPEPDVVAANDGTLSVPPPTQDSDSPGYSCSSSGGGAKTVICIIGN
jgi:hypothetical protein